MTHPDQLRDDLRYIANTLHRRERMLGTPSIYFLWAAIILVGFTLPDIAPHRAGWYWLVAGIGGGLLSMWLGDRDDRNRGDHDREAGRRFGLHWAIGGAAYLLLALPMATGRIPPQEASQYFLFLTGLLYALAGLHLLRPMLLPGLVMMASFALMMLWRPPYTWTITGVLIAASLAWAGWATLRARRFEPVADAGGDALQ